MVQEPRAGAGGALGSKRPSGRGVARGAGRKRSNLPRSTPLHESFSVPGIPAAITCPADFVLPGGTQVVQEPQPPHKRGRNRWYLGRYRLPTLTPSPTDCNYQF